MKKLIIIILSIIAIVIAASCIILTNKKTIEPAAVPVQTEQVEQKQPPAIRPKVEVKTPTLMDENDMPKSDVKVPEIG